MTKISFVSQTDGELYIDTEQVAAITANVPCEFELPKGAYQFRIDEMLTDDEAALWWPTSVFDLRLNGSGSVDILLEACNDVHITRHATVRKEVLFSDGMDEREDYMEVDQNPEVDPGLRNARLETLKTAYDKVIPFNEALVIVVREDLYGLYDLDREQLVQPVKYQKIWSATPEYAIIQQNGLCGLLSSEGEKLTPIKYTWIEANTSARLIRVSMSTYNSPESSFGLVDRSGHEILLGQHAGIHSAESDLFTLEDYDPWADVRISTYGFYNERTGVYIQPKYEEVGILRHNRMRVCRDGLWGYVDGRGHEVIVPRFDRVGDFMEQGFALAVQNDLLGVIDLQGNYRVQPEYRSIEVVTDHWAAARTQSDKCQLIDLRNFRVLPAEYDQIRYINDQVMLFKQGEQWGLLDQEAKQIRFDGAYDDLTRHDDHLIRARRDEFVGLLDLQGREVLPIVYEQIGECLNDLFSVIIPKENENSPNGFQWSCVDAQGHKKAPLGYDSTKPSLNARVFRVIRNGKVGLCDLEGNELLAPTFDNIYDFYNGVAVVCQNGRMGAIDASGHVIVPYVYDQLWNFLHDTTLACRDGQWGVVDQTGREVISCRFVATESRLHDGYAMVGITGLAMTDPDHPELTTDFVGYVNESGEEIQFRQEFTGYCSEYEVPTPNLDGQDIFMNYRPLTIY